MARSSSVLNGWWLNCVNRLSYLGAMDDGHETMRWASHYLSEMAKAIIDDVTLGLQDVP